MKVTLLGQAGLMFELDGGKTITVDPYLSDSAFKLSGSDFKRELPVDETFLAVKPDILVITHSHGDHMDVETLDKLLDTTREVVVLAPYTVYAKLYPFWRGRHNFIILRDETESTNFGVRFRGVHASHEDEYSIGVFFEAEGLGVYVTGDTLYSGKIVRSLNRRPDIMFPCINGRGNNMNCVDAARLTAELKPKLAVPVHWDMFKKYGADPKEYAKLAQSRETDVKILKSYCAYDLINLR